MTKYIDPLLDFSFKKIFGSEPNKDLLIALLNEIFSGRKRISDLVYNKNEYIGDHSDTGSVIFDLTCTDQDGAQFLIEVQRSNQSNLKKRMLYYSSKLISDQAPKGKRSAWNYQISEVYVIVIMDGFSMPDSNNNLYFHDICLCNRDTGEIFYQELGFMYLELINFVKEEPDLKTDLDKWLYVLKNMSKMEKLPLYLRKPIFEKLFNIAEYNKLTKEEQAMYDVSLKRKWDEENTRNYARQQGLEEGFAEGVEKGIEKGIEKGAEFKSYEVVSNLILAGRFSTTEIVSFANVTAAFVEKVRADLAREKK